LAWTGSSRRRRTRLSSRRWQGGGEVLTLDQLLAGPWGRLIAPSTDDEVYQATAVIPRRRRIHARSADVSADGPSMRSPGRSIGSAGMNAPPTQWPVLVGKVHYRPRWMFRNPV